MVTMENLPESKKNTLAFVGVGLGALGLICVLTLLGSPAGAAISIIGLIVSIIALVRAKRAHPDYQREGLSTFGIFVNSAVIIGFIVIVIALFSISAKMDAQECWDLRHQGANSTVVEECLNAKFEQYQKDEG